MYFANESSLPIQLHPGHSAMLLTSLFAIQQVGERAVIVSGMNAAEVGEIIGAYRDSGAAFSIAIVA